MRKGMRAVDGPVGSKTPNTTHVETELGHGQLRGVAQHKAVTREHKQAQQRDPIVTLHNQLLHLWVRSQYLASPLAMPTGS